MNLTPVFCDAVKTALDVACPEMRAIHPRSFMPLRSSGLSHDHIRLGDSGRLLRIPRGNQLGMSPEDYLTLQSHCFTTAALSGHAPYIAGVLMPQEHLPDGALVVEEIQGRKSSGPEDAVAIATAMAALHTIRPDQNTGLQIADQPLASQRFLITDVFAAAVDVPTLDPRVATMLRDEKQRVVDQIDSWRKAGLPLSLIGGDSHPANFLITPENKAYLVDVEFAMFDVPYVDLADASLPITQRLDPDMVTWPMRARDAFYRNWRAQSNADLVVYVDMLRPVAEDAVRLRTLLWLAEWSGKGQAQIEDKIAPRTRDNWDFMASTYLEPKCLARILRNQRDYPKLHPLP